jgi:glycosyltransferase involved in cell wall biosynthesis
MMKKTFEITVPVLNEEAGLGRDITTLYDFCMRKFPDTKQWKIVIADNGSTDRTREIAEGLASQRENINYLRLDRRGVGLALQSSWRNSAADIIGSMDLDLSTDLRHLPEALSALSDKRCDLVYGTRLHEDSKVTGRSIKRRAASRMLNSIIRNYLNVTISDGMCGFTFFRRPLLEKIIANGASSDGWFFQAELLIVSEWLGLKICELPVEWTEDKNSKARILPLAIEYLGAMRALKKKSPFITR